MSLNQDRKINLKNTRKCREYYLSLRDLVAVKPTPVLESALASMEMTLLILEIDLGVNFIYYVRDNKGGFVAVSTARRKPA